ncbi:unnamed protein product [Psylliodes chrysocephalus]|uniref:Uncharacterized protein n=1 Tax=Psylliodes chrysocephalus TaxID=3402493 RepID=A0A9P0CTP3_9CUCU|nr:unnamed protein product [Psylliodes chrysocephala]
MQLKYTHAESMQDEVTEIDSGDSSDYVPSSNASDSDDFEQCPNKIGLQSFSGTNAEDKALLFGTKIQKKQVMTQKEEQPENAYQHTLFITNAKFANLAKMCEDGTIPAIHHHFYRGLKLDANKKDRLPEPKFDEESDYE